MGIGKTSASFDRAVFGPKEQPWVFVESKPGCPDRLAVQRVFLVIYNQQKICLGVRQLILTDFVTGISGALPSPRTTAVLRRKLT